MLNASQRSPPSCPRSATENVSSLRDAHNTGALIIRLGCIVIISSPQISIGNYSGPCITYKPASKLATHSAIFLLGNSRSPSVIFFPGLFHPETNTGWTGPSARGCWPRRRQSSARCSGQSCWTLSWQLAIVGFVDELKG